MDSAMTSLDINNIPSLFSENEMINVWINDHCEENDYGETITTSCMTTCMHSNNPCLPNCI